MWAILRLSEEDNWFGDYGGDIFTQTKTELIRLRDKMLC